MPTIKSFILAVVTLGLASCTLALAAEPHAQGHTPAADHLRLDHGKKWQTDDVLRRGMDKIRAAVAAALPAIHKNTFKPVQYNTLAAEIQTQVDDVVANCKLSEEADQQLHVVLEQIIDGVAGIKAATGQDQGAETVARALDLYGEYFDHAGW